MSNKQYLGIIGGNDNHFTEFIRFEAPNMDIAKSICFAQAHCFYSQYDKAFDEEGNENFFCQTMLYDEMKGHGEHFPESDQFEVLPFRFQSLSPDLLIESLGEPLQGNSYSIEADKNGIWWITHKAVGSGEPLKQWLTGKPDFSNGTL